MLSPAAPNTTPVAKCEVSPPNAAERKMSNEKVAISNTLRADFYLLMEYLPCGAEKSAEDAYILDKV